MEKETNPKNFDDGLTQVAPKGEFKPSQVKSKEQNHNLQTKSASSLTGECESVHRELVLAKSEDKTADTEPEGIVLSSGSQTPNEEIIEKVLKNMGERDEFECPNCGCIYSDGENYYNWGLLKDSLHKALSLKDQKEKDFLKILDGLKQKDKESVSEIRTDRQLRYFQGRADLFEEIKKQLGESKFQEDKINIIKKLITEIREDKNIMKELNKWMKSLE